MYPGPCIFSFIDVTVTPAAATLGVSICFSSITLVRTDTSSGIMDCTFAAKASAPRFTCTRIWIRSGNLSIHLCSATTLPSSNRGFFAMGSSSSSSSSSSKGAYPPAMPMPGGRAIPAPGIGGGDMFGGVGPRDALGSLALIVDTPVMGPASSGRAPCGSAGVADEGAAASCGAEVPLAFVSWAVGGTMVWAGPASAPASRAAASAPASAASLICSSTEPNRSGLFATKLARLASTSSANADSLRARSTSASFWFFHFGSSSSTFRWLDISSAGMSWPVMGHRCIRRWAAVFLCRT
mmetsp:Transcript_14972/g.42839  ORF Transcript_14972/g.42839 Transcript_14972/m.42839 type:complete len:296 (+) Transcript_14972:141-1028(+)